jgi:hypothetical protein
MARARAEFRLCFSGIPTQRDSGGGLWDFAEHHVPERYDHTQMATYARRHQHEMTKLELKVVLLFWLGRLSYGGCGRELGCHPDRIRECVQRLRGKCQAWYNSAQADPTPP